MTANADSNATSLGGVQGYCCIFGETTRDMSENGEAPFFHLFRAGSIQIEGPVRIDTHHVPTAAFASTKDATLQIEVDGFGAWFQAILPPTRTGFDVANGLRGGRSLQCSCAVDVLAAAWTDDDVYEITRARLTAVSIVKDGRFPSARCWLSDEEPSDRVARDQQRRFLDRASTARLAAAAPRASVGRNDHLIMRHAMSWPQVRAAARALGINVAE